MTESIASSLSTANWVHDVGYANEKLHAGILARLLRRSTGSAQRGLVEALWNDATGQSLPAGPIADVDALREVQLPSTDRSRPRLDLLVSFKLNQREYRLGFELKVDNPPDDGQLKAEANGLVQKYPQPERALILLCLGAGQVAFSSNPAGVRRWSLATLLSRKELIQAALPGDPIVAGWLESLAIEQIRYQQILRLAGVDLEKLRARNFESYWLGALQRELEGPAMPSLSPWCVQLHANGPVITADGSWSCRLDGTIKTAVFLEIHWGCLYVKACSRDQKRVISPRPTTATFMGELETGLRSALPGAGLQKAKFRPGDHNAMLKLTLHFPREQPQDVRKRMEVVAAVWDRVTKAHGFRAEPPPS